MPRLHRLARIFLLAHAGLIVASIVAFRLIVNHPAPPWVDPAFWSAAYGVGMAWTGPLYIVTGFAAACCAWAAGLGIRRGSASAAAVVALALGVELLGVGTGFPFGAYGYGTALGPRVLGMVPVVIPLSWFLMLVASLGIAMRFRRGRAATALIAAAGLVAWDVLMDPAMSAAFPFWSWHQGGTYYGMPLVNWAGWLLTGAVLAAAALAVGGDGVRRAVDGRLPLVLYALNGVFPLALALESGMTTAALVGAAAMAAFAAAPWLAGCLHLRPAAVAPLEAR
jgi:putative membrane protein